MEEEKILSGYCRCLDQSRRVILEYQGSKILDVDCDFGHCPFQDSCPVAQSVREVLGQPEP